MLSLCPHFVPRAEGEALGWSTIGSELRYGVRGNLVAACSWAQIAGDEPYRSLSEWTISSLQLPGDPLFPVSEVGRHCPACPFITSPSFPFPFPQPTALFSFS